MERIIKASSNPGELVFDPFCGSGTVPVVCRRPKKFVTGNLPAFDGDLPEWCRRLDDAGQSSSVVLGRGMGLSMSTGDGKGDPAEVSLQWGWSRTMVVETKNSCYLFARMNVQRDEVI